jgi:hypothetical protein
MPIKVFRQSFAVRQYTVRKIALVFGTEDRPLFPEGPPEFGIMWGMLLA